MLEINVRRNFFVFEFQKLTLGLNECKDNESNEDGKLEYKDDASEVRSSRSGFSELLVTHFRFV